MARQRTIPVLLISILAYFFFFLFLLVVNFHSLHQTTVFALNFCCIELINTIFIRIQYDIINDYRGGDLTNERI